MTTEALFSIRPAARSDAAALGTVGYAAWCKGIGVHVGPDAHRRIGPETFAGFIAARPQDVLVAERGRELLGFAAAEGGGCYISDLWVAPAEEGRGVGAALLDALVAAIMRSGHPRAEIECLSLNARALALYRRRGFSPVWEGEKIDPTLQIALRKTLLVRRSPVRGLQPSSGRSPSRRGSR